MKLLIRPLYLKDKLDTVYIPFIFFLYSEVAPGEGYSPPSESKKLFFGDV